MKTIFTAVHSTSYKDVLKIYWAYMQMFCMHILIRQTISDSFCDNTKSDIVRLSHLYLELTDRMIQRFVNIVNITDIRMLY